MTSYLLRRGWQSLLVLFGVSVVVFLILHLTGDPALLLLPPDATAEDIVKFRHAMGFDDPVAVQYLRFLRGALRGDFGESLRHGEPAMGLVLERLPATFELAGAGLLIALCLAIPAGIVSAVRRNTAVDYVSTVVALLGQAMPTFWLGHHADPGVLRPAQLAAVVRPRRSRSPAPPRDHARPVHHRSHHSAHPLGHARGARPGLHPHRARQGRERAARRAGSTRSRTRRFRS